MDVECDSLSQKDINNSFSARKKKKKVFKTTLMPSKPPLFKRLETGSDDLENLLKTLLPSACIIDRDCVDIEKRTAARNSLSLGANEVDRQLKKKNISGVLFTSDVNPPTLVTHVIHRCHHCDVPMLKVNDLRSITKKTLGFECIALGFKKSFTTFSALLKLIYQENNRIAEDSVVEIEKDDEEVSVIEIEKEELSVIEIENVSDSSVIEIENNLRNVEEIENKCKKQVGKVFEYYRRIDNKTRTFSPEIYNKKQVIEPSITDNEFISVQNSTFCIDDTLEKGISTSLKNNLKRKAEYISPTFNKIKEKCKTSFVPAKVQKFGNNINRKKKQTKKPN